MRVSLSGLHEGACFNCISPPRYPYIATEVLCSEIWSIVETCMREKDRLLVPFWETVLDRPADEMKTQTIMASHFSKINSTFLTKKPEEVRAVIVPGRFSVLTDWVPDDCVHPRAARHSPAPSTAH